MANIRSCAVRVSTYILVFSRVAEDVRLYVVEGTMIFLSLASETMLLSNVTQKVFESGKILEKKSSLYHRVLYANY